VTDFDPSVALARAADGDQQAWDAIVERYSGLVWSVVRGFRLGGADAADVCQATWLRLVENVAMIQNGSGLGSWLATTARRESIDLLRRRGREKLIDPTDDTELPPAAVESPEAPMLRAEEDRLLWQAILRLPGRCVQLLRTLCVDPAPSYAVVAAALDIPVGSVGPTRARCLNTLRTMLSATTGR
jgi:RNA polymerase sigma factor (sigma-70 family)